MNEPTNIEHLWNLHKKSTNLWKSSFFKFDKGGVYYWWWYKIVQKCERSDNIVNALKFWFPTTPSRQNVAFTHYAKWWYSRYNENYLNFSRIKKLFQQLLSTNEQQLVVALSRNCLKLPPRYWLLVAFSRNGNGTETCCSYPLEAHLQTWKETLFLISICVHI